MTSNNSTDNSFFSMFGLQRDDEQVIPNSSSTNHPLFSNYSHIELYQPSFKLENQASDAEIMYPNEFYREQVKRTGKPVQISNELLNTDYNIKAAKKVNMSAFPHKYLAGAFDNKPEFDFTPQELPHVIKEPTQSTINVPNEEPVSKQTIKKYFSPKTGEIFEETLIARRNASANNPHNPSINKLTSNSTVTKTPKKRIAKFYSPRTNEIIERQIEEKPKNTAKNNTNLTTNGVLSNDVFTGLPRLAYKDLTSRNTTSSEHNIYVPVTQLQETPESLQQYLDSRGVTMTKFTNIVKMELREQTGKPFTRATQYEHDAAVTAAISEIEKGYHRTRQKAQKEMDKKYISSTGLLFHALEITFNSINKPYTPNNNRLIGKFEGRKEAFKMLDSSNIPISNVRLAASNMYDKIIDIIRHTTEYNMNPYMQGMQKEDILDIVESKVSSEYGNNNIIEIHNALGQELLNKVIDEDLEYNAINNLVPFSTALEFHSKQAIKKSKKILNQYNPNNSTTDIAMLLKEQTLKHSQKVGDIEQSRMLDTVATSLKKHSGISFDIIRSRIETYYKNLSFASVEQGIHPNRKSVFAAYGDKIMSKFQKLSNENKELIKLINNSSPVMRKIGIAALVAQDDSAKWLEIEKQENQLYTGSHYLAKLLTDLPDKSVDELKILFPDSFSPDISDEESKEILLLNSQAYVAEWDMIRRVASYTKDVEHGLIDHSNIATNIKKEVYGLGSFLFPKFHDHIEYLQKSAEEVNSRRSPSVEFFGNLTQNYFLDALSIMKGGVKGGSKVLLNKVLFGRGILNDCQSILATIHKAKREGKSYKQINADIRKTAYKIGSVRGSGFIAGKATKKILNSVNTPTRSKELISNGAETAASIVSKEEQKNK